MVGDFAVTSSLARSISKEREVMQPQDRKLKERRLA